MVLFLSFYRRTLANPRLLSLSDFWENNGNKTQEEIHRIKLEEEKFRREVYENLLLINMFNYKIFH